MCDLDKIYICLECGEQCQVEEETFDYAGTHCTGGRSGTFHTGVFLSRCCSAPVEVDYPQDSEEFQNEQL